MKDEWVPMPRYLLRKYLVKKILANEKALHGKKCLEIGYGHGDMLFFFFKMGLQVFGYDFSSSSYNSAITKIDEHSFLINNSIHLFKNKEDVYQHKYDYIVAFEVLEHIENDYQQLEKWHSMLTNNGKLIISTPAHMGKWGPNDELSGHYRRYEKPELIKKITNAGFKVNHFWNYGYPLTVILDVLLQKSYGSKKSFMSNEARSKASWLKPDNKKKIYRKFSNNFFMLPFYILQNLFLNKDIGSAYLITAYKKV